MPTFVIRPSQRLLVSRHASLMRATPSSSDPEITDVTPTTIPIPDRLGATITLANMPSSWTLDEIQVNGVACQSGNITKDSDTQARITDTVGESPRSGALVVAYDSGSTVEFTGPVEFSMS